MGYATGQFGKNHLGDLNEFLPTVHGFDEFFGYLYHLDAMEDPFWHSYPAALKDTVGPRNLIHSFATGVDDPTEQPRWGKVGKQTIVDEGPLPPHPIAGIKYNMETVDDDILDHTVKFIDKAEKDGKPFFVWMNPTRVHVISHLSPKYAADLTPENGWYLEEGVMKQLDDVVGGVMEKLKADGLDKNTIVVFTTDNGTENFTWPDGSNTPFFAGKGTIMEGGMRVPMIVRWPEITSRPERSRMASSRGWTFFPPSFRSPANRASRRTC
jgi:arylsulfatase A-like enzyme